MATRLRDLLLQTGSRRPSDVPLPAPVSKPD
jgi:hypothetical protein